MTFINTKSVMTRVIDNKIIIDKDDKGGSCIFKNNKTNKKKKRKAKEC